MAQNGGVFSTSDDVGSAPHGRRVGAATPGVLIAKDYKVDAIPVTPGGAAIPLRLRAGVNSRKLG